MNQMNQNIGFISLIKIYLEQLNSKKILGAQNKRSKISKKF